MRRAIVGHTKQTIFGAAAARNMRIFVWSSLLTSLGGND